MVRGGVGVVLDGGHRASLAAAAGEGEEHVVERGFAEGDVGRGDAGGVDAGSARRAGVGRRPRSSPGRTIGAGADVGAEHLGGADRRDRRVGELELDDGVAQAGLQLLGGALGDDRAAGR